MVSGSRYGLAALRGCSPFRRCNSAQTYPNQPILSSSASPAGGGTDILAPIVGIRCPMGSGQPVVIENKPAAGADHRHRVCGRSAPDGYTLLIGASGRSSSTQPSTKLPLHTLRDFNAGVRSPRLVPFAPVVSPPAPWRTSASSVAYVKANPSKANYACASAAFQRDRVIAAPSRAIRGVRG